MSMNRSMVLSLLLLAAVPCAIAKRVDWDMKGAQELNEELKNLPVQDQQGILHRLGTSPKNLRAMRVEIASGHLFLIQGVGVDDLCSPTGNCRLWVLDGDYKILLVTTAQTFRLQSSASYGLPDVLTSMHGSAFDSDLTRWQFNGLRYRRSGCVTAEYGNALGEGDPTWYKRPHITSRPCLAR